MRKKNDAFLLIGECVLIPEDENEAQTELKRYFRWQMVQSAGSRFNSEFELGERSTASVPMPNSTKSPLRGVVMDKQLLQKAKKLESEIEEANEFLREIVNETNKNTIFKADVLKFIPGAVDIAYAYRNKLQKELEAL